MLHYKLIKKFNFFLLFNFLITFSTDYKYNNFEEQENMVLNNPDKIQEISLDQLKDIEILSPNFFNKLNEDLINLLEWEKIKNLFISKKNQQLLSKDSNVKEINQNFYKDIPIFFPITFNLVKKIKNLPNTQIEQAFNSREKQLYAFINDDNIINRLELDQIKNLKIEGFDFYLRLNKEIVKDLNPDNLKDLFDFNSKENQEDAAYYDIIMKKITFDQIKDIEIKSFDFYFKLNKEIVEKLNPDNFKDLFDFNSKEKQKNMVSEYIIYISKLTEKLLNNTSIEDINFFINLDWDVIKELKENQLKNLFKLKENQKEIIEIIKSENDAKPIPEYFSLKFKENNKDGKIAFTQNPPLQSRLSLLKDEQINFLITSELDQEDIQNLKIIFPKKICSFLKNYKN